MAFKGSLEHLLLQQFNLLWIYIYIKHYEVSCLHKPMVQGGHTNIYWHTYILQISVCNHSCPLVVSLHAYIYIYILFSFFFPFFLFKIFITLVLYKLEPYLVKRRDLIIHNGRTIPQAIIKWVTVGSITSIDSLCIHDPPDHTTWQSWPHFLLFVSFIFLNKPKHWVIVPMQPSKWELQHKWCDHKDGQFLFNPCLCHLLKSHNSVQRQFPWWQLSEWGLQFIRTFLHHLLCVVLFQ